MTNCNSARTPLNIGTKLTKATTEEMLDHQDSSSYRTLMGSILYLATNTRLDLAYSMAYLSQLMLNRQGNRQAAKQVLLYLKATQDMTLRYRKMEKPVQLYVDADWASDKTDRKSYSGYLAIIAGGAVSWSCRKQTVTAQSTLEAEFLALGEATREAIWLKNLLTELRMNQYCERAIEIFIDNTGAKAIAENRTMSERTKHLDLKSFFVQGAIEEGRICLNHVPSNQNIADGLTKVLDHTKMVAHQRIWGERPGGVLEVITCCFMLTDRNDGNRSVIISWRLTPLLEAP